MTKASAAKSCKLTYTHVYLSNVFLNKKVTLHSNVLTVVSPLIKITSQIFILDSKDDKQKKRENSSRYFCNFLSN